MNKLNEMIGKVPYRIEQDENNKTLTFYFTDNTKGKFYHEQDFSEYVRIEDVNGDWSDLVGNPILVAEERTYSANEDEVPDCGTWTFYTFRGINGSVDVRWLGESNGYYSESVYFEMLGEDDG